MQAMIDQGVRRLAAARVIDQIKICLAEPLGLEELVAWFEGEGRDWLFMAGLYHLLELSSEDLARLVFEHAPVALDPTRRCINCAFLERVNGNGRVRCKLGIWQKEMGRKREEYALVTVQSRFDGCDYFQRNEETQDYEPASGSN